MDWRAFKKLQDDDLIADLARRQADDEGRMAILRAQNEQQAARERTAVARDNAETNRVYREGLLDEREASRLSRESLGRETADKAKAEAERLRRIEQEGMNILNDPNAPEELKAQVRASRAGLPVQPFKVGGGMKKVYSLDRKTMKPVLAGEIEENAEMRMEPAQPQININPSGMKDGEEARLTLNLMKTYEANTKADREILRQYSVMQSALDGLKSGTITSRDAATQPILVTFQKILDPISVVRETEYARSAEGQALADRIHSFGQRMVEGGVPVTDANLREYVNMAEQWVNRARAEMAQEQQRMKAFADHYKLRSDLIFRQPSEGPVTAPLRTATPPPASPAPAGAPAPPAKRDSLGIR